MEIRYPNYYKKFHCIAGDCPDTCCAGWEIPVDRDSEKRYRDAQKRVKEKNRAFARKLKKHIKNGRIISEDVTCPFLNRDGLCEMYIELGPEALCHTCKRHPRHVEDYGNLHEIVLLLSCPEVARLVLEENDGSFYVRKIPEKSGNIDGIDEELLEILLEVRDQIWNIGKNRGLSIEKRMAFALALAHDVQRRLVNHDDTGIREVLTRYQKDGAEQRFMDQWKRKCSPEAGEEGLIKDIGRFFLMADFMEEFSDLEPICRDWPEMLEAARVNLYHSKDSRERYHEIREDFWRNNQEATGDFEKLFGYFIYSFFLTALYDRDVLTKVKMAVICTMAIEELYKNAETLDLDERLKICHALARQVENSDENREKLEQILKQRTYGARRIISILANPFRMERNQGAESRV